MLEARDFLLRYYVGITSVLRRCGLPGFAWLTGRAGGGLVNEVLRRHLREPGSACLGRRMSATVQRGLSLIGDVG